MVIKYDTNVGYVFPMQLKLKHGRREGLIAGFIPYLGFISLYFSYLYSTKSIPQCENSNTFAVNNIFDYNSSEITAVIRQSEWIHFTGIQWMKLC